MRKPKPFRSAKQLDTLIDAYFRSLDTQTQGKTETKSAVPEPPTFAGLLLFAGFTSYEEFDKYAAKPKFSETLSRASLKVQYAYEKKLHGNYSSGAVFALKNLFGWNDQRTDKKTIDNDLDHVLRVEMVPSIYKPVSSESEVVL